MPIAEPQTTTTWRDQISEAEVQTLIESKIDLKQYYAIDELWNDMFHELTSTGIHLGPDLITLIQPIWDAHLPVTQPENA